MSISMDLVINTPEGSVDMKAGLDTMSGVSGSVQTIAETILLKKAPHRNSGKKKVRTILKQTFKGSYGHIFSVDVDDDNLTKRLRSIGRPVFVELISYFFAESLYKEHQNLSPRANKVVEDLGNEANELIRQLRKSPLRKLHEVSRKFDLVVKIRYRKNKHDKTIIGAFDRSTAEAVDAKKSREEYWIKAGISRFNINTGNGRLVVEGDDHTVAFGFSSYKNLTMKAKKFFTENLNYNNGLEAENYKYLSLNVSPVKLRDGTVVKYMVKGYGD
ncbi:hypothetical protein [Marinobacter salicampi]|uniref:hypothetical protein n=1 Tax=Marinobacter salicampi TaxID=435907 RepID=UPI0014072AF5|nr:hypothetical protein [Marinobacter salicampi]